MPVHTLLNAQTANQTSRVFEVQRSSHGLGIETSITGTGAVGATVDWYGTNTPSAASGILLATSSLAGTDSDVARAALTDALAVWAYMYCVLSSISGTGAAVTAKVGANG